MHVFERLEQGHGDESSGTMTASALRRLPDAQRNSLLTVAAEAAAAVYGADPALQQFEAFDEVDLDEIAQAVALCIGT